MWRLLQMPNRYLISSVYNSIKVSRSPDHGIIYYLNNETTVVQFIKHVEIQFPQSKLYISVDQNQLLGMKISPEKIEQNSQKCQQMLFFQSLIQKQIKLCQFQEQSTISLIFGLELQEYHLTNNKNIPEIMAQNLMVLNKLWSQPDIKVKEALNPSQTLHLDDIESIKQQWKQSEKVCSESASQIFYMKNYFDENASPGSHLSRKFILRMASLMSYNWVFLFVVTYGKYGWDVGQPISYLTNIFIELLATIRVFNLHEAIQSKFDQQKWLLFNMFNVKPNLKMNYWRIGYHRRHL